MANEIYNVTVKGEADGQVTRLGLGHAWVWTRANGSEEVFDCGLSISHVLEYAPKRIGAGYHDVDMHCALMGKLPRPDYSPVRSSRFHAWISAGVHPESQSSSE